MKNFSGDEISVIHRPKSSFSVSLQSGDEISATNRPRHLSFQTIGEEIIAILINADDTFSFMNSNNRSSLIKLCL